jgi:polyisoprenoid-binding protein YceI
MTEAALVRTINGVEAPVAGTWEIDPAHSSMDFVARYLMVTKVRGHFSDYSGSLHVAERPEDSWAEVVIKAASIDTGNEQRDGHLRSPDFLDVEHYPEIRFRSTKIEVTGRTTLRVTGDLTIRDVTRPLVLEAEYGGVTRDPFGNTKAAFSASTEIDRDEFGAKWNVALETGGVLVGRQVKLELDVLAVLKEDGQDS